MAYGEIERADRIALQDCTERRHEIIPQLKQLRFELVARIEKIDHLLQLLEKNPDFVKMMDLSRELT